MKAGLGTVIFFIYITFISSPAQETADRTEILETLANMETSNKPVEIYVIVALCDNEHQGIVPVAPKLGDGDDPDGNLYWGAEYGVKKFIRKSPHWNLTYSEYDVDEYIAERCVYEHAHHHAALIADAYRGKYIKESIERFFKIVADQCEQTRLPLLVIYIGHNGLMDFNLTMFPIPDTMAITKDIMIFACASKYYFSDIIKPYPVFPVLWTTALCAPEAYILEAALEAWLDQKDTRSICTAAADAYARYQQCTVKAAKRIFATGW